MPRRASASEGCQQEQPSFDPMLEQKRGAGRATRPSESITERAHRCSVAPQLGSEPQNGEPTSSARWQAERWSGTTSRNAGRSTRQRSIIRGQRG